MKNCARCGKPLETDSKKEEFCVECLVLAASEESSLGEKEIHAAVELQAAEQVRRRRWVRAAQAVVVAVGAYSVYMNVSSVRQLSVDTKPVRWGTYETDRDTDRCITNLWKALDEMRSGKMDLSCPLTGAAYRVDDGPGGKFVRCPNPVKHGLKELRAGGSRGIPEVVR